MVGTDARNRQSLMWHSRFTATAEIYEQDLPEIAASGYRKAQCVSELKTELGQKWDNRDCWRGFKLFRLWWPGTESNRITPP